MELYKTAIVCLFAVAAICLKRGYLPSLIFASVALSTMANQISLGPVSFPLVRIVILLSTIRTLTNRPWRESPPNQIDRVLMLFLIWILVARSFHEGTDISIIGICGYILNFGGLYTVFRWNITSSKQLDSFIQSAIYTAAITALVMFYEKIAGINLFFRLENNDSSVMLRNGAIRAKGPFLHPINSGMLGALVALIPFALSQEKKFLKTVGVMTGIAIAILSASSTPIVSTAFGFTVVALWRFRNYRHWAIWIFASIYLFIEVFANYPAYFIISRIDLASGSTGWHRAELIRVTIQHFSEWWLIGTEYTNHWMYSGVAWSPNHIDITNYYIYFGVMAGLPTVVLIFLLNWRCFTSTSLIIKSAEDRVLYSEGTAKRAWSLAALVFCNAFASLSLTFFDQSFAIYWIPFALISIVLSNLRERKLTNE